MTRRTAQTRFPFITTTCLFSLVLILMVTSPAFGRTEGTLTPPKWISIYEDRGMINLRWFRVQEAVEYIVLRRDGEKGEFKNIGKVSNPAFADIDIKAGSFYFYKVVPVDREGVEGAVSETRYYRTPPDESLILLPPEWSTYIQSPKGIALSWSHPSGRQVLAYNLYRRAEGESTFNLLTSDLNTNFRDQTAKVGVTYQYVLTTLDRKLQESDFSEPLIVTFTDAAAAVTDEWFSSVDTLEDVVQLTEFVTQYSWEEYGFVSPTDLAWLSSDGTLYVSDSGTGLVTVLTIDGKVLRSFGGRGIAPWQFERLLGISVDAGGYLFAADAYKGEIVVFNSHGAFSRRIRLEPQIQNHFGRSLLVRYPWFRLGIVDVEVMPNGDFLVVDNPNGWIYRFDSDYSLVKVIGERGHEPGKMQNPTFSHLDSKGRILVADTLNSRVQVFRGDGSFHSIMGERGLGIGQFLRPKGVASDSKGRIFVADSQLNVIQVFDPGGKFVSLLGDEKGLPIDLGSPNGMVFIEPDLIVICEKLSRRIQVRRVLDVFLSDTVIEEEPEKGISRERILAPLVREPVAK